MSEAHVTPDRLFRMRDSLRQAQAEYSEYLSFQLWPCRPGSPAVGELAASSGREGDLRNAICLGMQLIESAGEHLLLFAKGFDPPYLAFAPLTCARGVLEAAAYAAWLLDPNIDARDRIGRGLARRMQGLDEQRKFGISYKNDGIRDHSQSRIDDVKARSDATSIAAARHPGATEVIGQQLGNESLYRLLSAIAHGHSWSHIACGYKDAGTLSEECEIRRLEKAMDPRFPFTVGVSSFMALSRATWFLVRLIGLGRERFSEIVDAFHDRNGISPTGDPYWRKA